MARQRAPRRRRDTKRCSTDHQPVVDERSRRSAPADANGGAVPAKAPLRSGVVLAGAAALVAAMFVAYAPALNGEFIWDDTYMVIDSPLVTETDGLRRIWTTDESEKFWIGVLSTFWFQYRLWGDSPVGYHVVNVLFHAANGILLWMLLRRLGVRGAAVAGAIFCLHPVHVESVAWIIELKNLQSGFFYLAGALLFLRYRERDGTTRYLAALAVFVLAVLSKTSSVTLPAALLLVHWWKGRRWTRRDVAALVPFFVVALAAAVMTVVLGRAVETVHADPEWSAGLAERTARAGWAVWFYLFKIVLPQNLVFVYPQWAIDPGRWAVYLPSLAVAAGGVLLVLGRWRWCRGATVGLGFFLLNLLPVVGFFNMSFMRYTLVADHLQYLATIGVIPLAVSLTALALQRVTPSAKAYRTMATFLSVTAVATLGVLTWRQAHLYQTEEGLWRQTLQRNPNAWMAHNNLGDIIARRGEYEEACRHYQRALAIDDRRFEPHFNYANALNKLQRYPEAVREYERALTIKPRHARAHAFLGAALVTSGRADDAVQALTRAIELDPALRGARLVLGRLLVGRGRKDEAAAQFRKLLELDPDDARALAALQQLDRSD